MKTHPPECMSMRLSPMPSDLSTLRRVGWELDGSHWRSMRVFAKFGVEFCQASPLFVVGSLKEFCRGCFSHQCSCPQYLGRKACAGEWGRNFSFDGVHEKTTA